MLTILYLATSLIGGAALLLLVNTLFAGEVSRAVEGAFDFVEFKLALRSRRRGAVSGRGGARLPDPLAYTQQAVRAS